MSKEAFREIMRDAPDPQKSESMGIQAIAPGLSLQKILGDIGHELGQQAQHGAHEAAAALFNGSGYVMYPRVGKELDGQTETQHSLKEILEATVAPQPPVIEREQEHGREI